MREGIQHQLDALVKFTSWAKLNFNIDKFGCLSIINSSSKRHYVELFCPFMGTNSIPSRMWDNSCKYLGKDYFRVRNRHLDKLSLPIQHPQDIQ